MLTSSAVSLLKLQPEWWGRERVQCLRKKVQILKVQTISQSLLKLMSIESVMPSSHLILCLLAVTPETHEVFWCWENPKVPLCSSLFFPSIGIYGFHNLKHISEYMSRC